MGNVVLFFYGDFRGVLLYEGIGVRKGVKYVIWIEVEYDVEFSE